MPCVSTHSPSFEAWIANKAIFPQSTSRKGFCSARVKHRQRQSHRDERQRQHPPHVIPRPRRDHAPDAHPEKAGQQHDVREERQEDDGAREPPDARELEKKNQKTAEKEIEARAACGLGHAERQAYAAITADSRQKCLDRDFRPTFADPSSVFDRYRTCDRLRRLERGTKPALSPLLPRRNKPTAIAVPDGFTRDDAR